MTYLKPACSGSNLTVKSLLAFPIFRGAREFTRCARRNPRPFRWPIRAGSKLSSKIATRSMFRSLADLQAAINRFVAEHNQQSKPCAAGRVVKGVKTQTETRPELGESPQAPTAGAPPKPDRTVLTSMGPGARSPSVSREQPNALRSFRDFRLRGRRARGVRLANGQPQFAFAVESRANSAAGQARSPARSSSEPRRRRRRHPSFGWKRRLLKPKEESRDCWLLRWARNDGTD